MIRYLLALAVPAIAALAQNETITYHYNGRPLPIVYSDDVFTIAEIHVPRALQIDKVTVRLQIDYPQVGDLNLYLYSPYGTRTRLLEKNCARLANIDTTFDDEATTKFSSFCPQEAGRGPFQPNDPLANARGETSLGIWRLAVQNNGTQTNRGTLRMFAVTVTGNRQNNPIITPDTIIDSASGRTGTLATGQLVTIYGSGLGPSAPASASGDWPSTLGGTTVTLDGVAIAIGYTSFGEVQVQIPFGLLTPQEVVLRVAYAGQSSAGIVVLIRGIRPGAYTTAASGRQAKAFNQNGLLNSKANPAAKGSYVAVYASGLGAVTPAVGSGNKTPLSPLSTTVYPVAVFVSGEPAAVAFAGLAPALVGVYQVNFAIPATARTGTNDLVIAAVNGYASQDNVTIEVQ